MDEQNPREDLVETIFRNGTITVVGVLLAFSLGFVSQWAANPLPWKLEDIFAIGPLLIGIVLQMRALAMLLRMDCLRRRVFERANRIFMTGVVLTAAGVGMAILLDLFRLAAQHAAA
jgi:hypothetical protein